MLLQPDTLTFFFLGGGGVGAGLLPFLDYFTYFELIQSTMWRKTGVPGEKPPDMPASRTWLSHLCSEQGANHDALTNEGLN